MAQIPSQHQGRNQETLLDSKRLQSTLKEFFDPLRTNDSRADFFAAYHRESREYDREYLKKYDDDLDTSLIFAGLFSAVTSAFIASVQPKLEPDQSEMTAIYMQILIHTMNNSLFPDVDPASAAWTGPPPEIVTVQSILYASLATSLLAAFLAMLGKQWINQYVRGRGSSREAKSRGRQLKFDGLKKWRFYLAIEILPVMLQLGLLLLGSALSLYLWNISRTVAGVIIAFMLLGVTSYLSLTLVAILYDHCPYQTPLSIIILVIYTLPAYLLSSPSAFGRWFRSLRSLGKSATSFVKTIYRCLRTGVRKALQNLGTVPESPDMELGDTYMEPPDDQPFWVTSIKLEAHKTDVRCISWTLNYSTDIDVIFSTALFAADVIGHPEIASALCATDVIKHPEISGALSPHTLSDFLHECLLDGRIIPDKLKHVNAIGLALGSVLSIQLCMEPEPEGLRELRRTIRYYTDSVSTSESKLLPGVAIPRIVSQIPWDPWSDTFQQRGIFSSIPNHLSTAHGLCFSRTILQTIWQWRRADPTAVLNLKGIDLVFKGLMANEDHIVPTIKANCFLIMTVSLKPQVPELNSLFIPDDGVALSTATIGFHEQLLASISDGRIDSNTLTSILSATSHLDPFRTLGSRLGFEWMTGILKSKYPKEICHQMTSSVVQLFGKEVDTHPQKRIPPEWVPPFLDFLSLSEEFYTTGSSSGAWLTALRILSCRQVDAEFGLKLLPILTSTLLQDHPLKSRGLTLKVFHQFASGWFSPQMEVVSGRDLGKLLRTVGDPFKYLDLPLLYGQPGSTTDYEPMMTAVVLIEFAFSDLWRDHLDRSNFDSCEEVLSTEEGRRAALRWMVDKATHTWSAFLCTAAKIIAAIGRLEELQCLNTAEVVILWAWTTEVMDQADHEGWRLIEDDTVRFYQTHGTERLTTLRRHIIDNHGTIGVDRQEFLLPSVDSIERRVAVPFGDHGAGEGGASHQGEGGCH